MAVIVDSSKDKLFVAMSEIVKKAPHPLGFVSTTEEGKKYQKSYKIAMRLKGAPTVNSRCSF